MHNLRHLMSWAVRKILIKNQLYANVHFNMNLFTYYGPFQIELLMTENKGLKQQLLDMESKCEKQEGHIRSEKDEISRIEAALFNAKSEVCFTHFWPPSTNWSFRVKSFVCFCCNLNGFNVQIYDDRFVAPAEFSFKWTVILNNLQIC